MEVWAMLPPPGASGDPVSAGTPPSQDPQGGYSRPAQARVGGHRSEIADPFRSIIAPRPPHATGWCWWAVKVRARGRYRNQLISVDFLKTAIRGQIRDKKLTATTRADSHSGTGTRRENAQYKPGVCNKKWGI